MTFIPWQWAIFTLTADYLYNWPFDNTTQPVSMAVRETLPHSVEGKVPQQLDFWDLNNTSIQTGYMLPEHCLASSKIRLHIPFLSLRLLVSFSVTKWRKSFKRDSIGQRKLSQGGHITVLKYIKIRELLCFRDMSLLEGFCLYTHKCLFAVFS